MPDDRTVDPRFDPRYQRGYDPAAVPVSAQPVTVRPPSDEPVRVAPASPVPPASDDRPKAVDEALDEPFEHEDEDELVEGSIRNPFRLALLLASLGLIVIAVALMWWVASNPNAFLFGSAVETAASWMFQEVTTVVPPAAMVAGFVGLGAWLGLGALASLRTPPPRHPEHDDGE